MSDYTREQQVADISKAFSLERYDFVEIWFNDDEELIEVETDQGLYLFRIGSDDDRMVFTNIDHGDHVTVMMTVL